MKPFRIALAVLPFPPTPEDSIHLAERAIAGAANAGADLICFPECYVPGYRGLGTKVPPPDEAFLERAWSAIAAAAARGRVGVVLGTERVDHGRLLATALVIDRNGTRAGFQDKVQIDSSEEPVYTPGSERRVFTIGGVTIGVVICHEGWRYPETVRWAARRGAQLVCHPHFHVESNTFHDKAISCRAAENTCYFASVNYAGTGAPATSAVAGPDGTLVDCRPYGHEGLLIADLDIPAATRLLADRFKPI